jgi:hypothetical protein
MPLPAREGSIRRSFTSPGIQQQGALDKIVRGHVSVALRYQDPFNRVPFHGV